MTEIEILCHLVGMILWPDLPGKSNRALRQAIAEIAEEPERIVCFQVILRARFQELRLHNLMISKETGHSDLTDFHGRFAADILVALRKIMPETF